MKPTPIKIPKLPRHEALARYARARILADRGLVLKCIRPEPTAKPANFVTNPLLFGQ